MKWSKHAPQTVEIYYNGIGFIDKQHQDMESLQPLKTEEPHRHRKHDNLSGDPRN